MGAVRTPRTPEQVVEDMLMAEEQPSNLVVAVAILGVWKATSTQQGYAAVELADAIITALRTKGKLVEDGEVKVREDELVQKLLDCDAPLWAAKQIAARVVRGKTQEMVRVQTAAIERAFVTPPVTDLLSIAIAAASVFTNHREDEVEVEYRVSGHKFVITKVGRWVP